MSSRKGSRTHSRLKATEVCILAVNSVEAISLATNRTLHDSLSNMKEQVPASDSSDAMANRAGDRSERLKIQGRFYVTCRDKDGKFKWRDIIENLVTTAGKNDLLDKYLLSAGFTSTFRMGLKGTGAAAVGDTQASHAGWLEVGGANAPAYTGNRKDVTMGAAAAGSSVSPAQVFAITSGGTVAGCFTNNGGSATKDDTTGVLYSAGNFTGGDKIVAASDTLTVTYTATIT